jgi:molecular chaperone DnaK
LKDAHKSEDLDAMDKAMEELNAAWQTASQHIYNAQQQAGDQGQQQGPEAAAHNDGSVADAEYEEVK